MKLYLVRHGDALPKEVDREQPLSDHGRAEVERVASFLGPAGVRIARIVHNGKLRAQQTAELLAVPVGTGQAVEPISGIAPLDPVGEFARAANTWTDDTMVVGHLPFMGKLVSRLIHGREEVPAVVYQPGTVVCLERFEDGSWSIAWMIHPGLLCPPGEEIS